MQGGNKMWDVWGDSFDDMDDLGLKFACLSLDEPELESMLFVNECAKGDDVISSAEYA